MPDPDAPDLNLTIAEDSDLPDLRALMMRSIGELQKGFLTPQQIEASFEIMGLDTQLVADRTYFAVWSGQTLAGCGGWSRRATLFGGDHTKGRDAALLDPAVDSARVRAMYTNPDFARRGVGRLILDACHAAAAAEAFQSCELAATLSGEPLYRSVGYQEVERFTAVTSAGVEVPLLRMRRGVP